MRCKSSSGQIARDACASAMRLLRALQCACVGVALALAYAEPPTVQTRFGTVRGVLSEPLDAEGTRGEYFYGVPYATPPLGEHRFEVSVRMCGQ